MLYPRSTVPLQGWTSGHCLWTFTTGKISPPPQFNLSLPTALHTLSSLSLLQYLIHLIPSIVPQTKLTVWSLSKCVYCDGENQHFYIIYMMLYKIPCWVDAINHMHGIISYNIKIEGWPPLWSSGQSSWLQIQRSWVQFPPLPDFLRSSGSGTGSTQPGEYNWGATWIEMQLLRVEKIEIHGRGNSLGRPRETLCPHKVGTNFAEATELRLEDY
jgi:hypothetical protein